VNYKIIPDILNERPQEYIHHQYQQTNQL